MKYKYKKEHIITYSEADKNLKLSLYSSMQLAQDIMTKYFQTFGSDNNTIMKNDNAVWVLSKAKIHFNKYPNWLENIKCHSYTTVYKMVRVQIETIFLDQDDEILFIVMQECCPIDIKTRKPRKINTISYPKDMEITEAVLKEDFSRFTSKFKEENLAYNQKVQALDIDFSDHTNNVSYVKYLINTFSSDYWSNKIITDFEIHYINESRENEKLDIYKIEQDNCKIEFLIKNNDKEVAKARISYKQK